MAVRVGLNRVFGLAEATGVRIVTARGDRRFRSLADVLDRARPTLPEAESLILAGALDWTGRSRPSLLLETRAGASAWSAPRPHAATPAGAAGGRGAVLIEIEPVAACSTPALPEFDAAERVAGEMRATGLWFSGHPLDATPRAARQGTVPASSLAAHAGRRVAVVGLPCAYRRVETKQGQRMLFMTLADESGLAECVFFPDAYRAHAAAARGEIVRAEGRVDDTLGAVTLTVERATAMERPAGHDS